MVCAVDPLPPEEHLSLRGTIAALEAAVMILLGYVAARGTNTVEDAHSTLADLGSHSRQIREALRSMVAYGEELKAEDFDDAVIRELDRIFAAVRFSVNKPH